MRVESLREGVALAVEQIRSNRFRSILTILGVVVGVATVMAMSALIAGVRSSILDEITQSGPKNFFVARFDFNDVRVAGPSNEPPWGDNPKITVEEARQLEGLSKVRKTIVGLDASGEFDAGSNKVEGVQIYGRDHGWSLYTTGNLLAGHDFQPSDVRASRPVAVISRPLAETLFGVLDPVGRPVRINGQGFTVIGVFEMSGNIFASVVKHFAVVPYTAAIKHLNAWDGMLGVFVVTAPEASQAEAIDQVVTTLRLARSLRPGEPNDFAVIRQEEMVETFNQITGIFFIVMLALSSVGLLVGGVGVIAIMMIAVTERTREIGIRKAIGATRREILWQFLVEAVTVTVAGAALGMVLGAGAAFLVQGLTPIPAKVPAWAVAAALGMAALAGIAFGLWPAWRASRLDPVAALRYE